MSRVYGLSEDAQYERFAPVSIRAQIFQYFFTDIVVTNEPVLLTKVV